MATSKSLTSDNVFFFENEYFWACHFLKALILEVIDFEVTIFQSTPFSKWLIFRSKRFSKKRFVTDPKSKVWSDLFWKLLIFEVPKSSKLSIYESNRFLTDPFYVSSIRSDP